MPKKTSNITIDSIKDSDGWYSLYRPWFVRRSNIQNV